MDWTEGDGSEGDGSAGVGVSDLMISTLGLFSPLKKWLLRSVRTTSLSTVNWTFLQNSLCSSGLMDSLEKYTPTPGNTKINAAARFLF